VHSYPAADDSFGQILVAGDIVEHECLGVTASLHFQQRAARSGAREKTMSCGCRGSIRRWLSLFDLGGAAVAETLAGAYR